MIFQIAERETRARFAEANALLVYLRSIAPSGLEPIDNTQKALRGLWLVSLYAAVERATNVIVEAALQEISSHDVQSIDCVPGIHSIFHFSKVQSVQSCGQKKIFDTSIKLFEASFGRDKLRMTDNPLADNLQNVGANTLVWVTGLFGGPSLQLDQASSGRVNTLRERRNAVAHGRESASAVGERYTVDELTNVYNAADEVISAFLLNLNEHCTEKRYMRASA